MKNKWLEAHLAVIAANLIFGANFAIMKLVTPKPIPPLALNVIRIGSSVAFFWIFFLFKPKDPWINKKDLPRFLGCALTGVVINQLLFVRGISYTTPIHGALLMLITPILITFIAAWLLKEKISLLKLFGLALGVSGACILILQKDQSGGVGENMLLGDLLIFLNAVSYSFYLVMVKPLMKTYPPLKVIRWVFTIGAVFLIPIGWSDLDHIVWQEINQTQWVNIAFVVIGATFLAYLFNIYGVNTLGPSVTGAYIYSQPVFAALLSVWMYNEKIDAYKIISAILIFVGVFLAGKSSPQLKPLKTPNLNS